MAENTEKCCHKHCKNEKSCNDDECKKDCCENESCACGENCKCDELDEKTREEKCFKYKFKKISKDFETLNAAFEEINKKASQYLSTASYYKNEAETNKKDFDRYKERNKNIEVDAKSKANEIVALKLLPVIDNFNQAIASLEPEIMKGFAMIYSGLIDTLKEIGVVEINCKNETLDPEFHNCIETIETEDKELDGKIATIYQKGYMFAESKKLIRPATVSIYKIK